MKRSIHVFSVIVASSTFILLIAGGLVTSNDAGLAVPDWPLSYGSWMPPMVGGIFYEHGHRIIAASVGLMTLLLCVALFMTRTPRWMRVLGVTTLITVILQGILGGITVRYQLPLAISVIHACLAQIFFCLTTSLALFSSRTWSRGWDIPTSLTYTLGPRAILLTSSILIQLILGALLRHTGVVDGSKAGRLVSWVVIAHILGAIIVTVLVLRVGVMLLRHFEEGLLYQLGVALLSLLVVQVSLGVGSFWVRLKAMEWVQPLPLDTWITTSHLAVGALMLVTSLLVIFCLKNRHNNSTPLSVGFTVLTVVFK